MLVCKPFGCIHGLYVIFQVQQRPLQSMDTSALVQTIEIQETDTPHTGSSGARATRRKKITNLPDTKHTMETASKSSLSSAVSSFTVNLFKSLGDKDKTSNVFFSPLSISSALSMVQLGARGDTATQMAECLKIKDITVEVHSRFASLVQELNKPDAPYALSVANRLYGEQSYQFIKEFVGGTRKHYKAELETVDFVNKAEEARVHINTWVEKQTAGKIKDVLAEGVVNSLTRLVLVNAIYLKATWFKWFFDSDTRDAKFRLNKNDSKTVKMMHQNSKFQLRKIQEASCQVIELLCGERDLSMLIFLPDDIEDSTTGLEKLEQQLTYENFVEWTRRDKMDEYQVDLGLPRFRIEENYELNDVLKNMGMKDAFDESKCDFSGMSPDKDLVLSKVVHKTFLSVDEKGIEAAAATGAVCETMCLPPRATFIADHPFLFFIRHNATNTVLFAGRCCSPE